MKVEAELLKNRLDSKESKKLEVAISSGRQFQSAIVPPINVLRRI